MNILTIILKTVVLAVIAPLLSGVVTKIKNNLRMRKGQSIFQPYYNLSKLFSKEEVVSQSASWIFSVTPVIVISASAVAAVLVPIAFVNSSNIYIGDFFLVIFIFALGKFFITLAALDTAGSFGGMGSSREMFISSFVEPAACLVVFAVSYSQGSTAILAGSNSNVLSVSLAAALISLLLIIITETSRIPVDNQETHLELTMIHEAMKLEYYGRSLALIELGGYLKQIVWFSLMCNLFFNGLFVNPWVTLIVYLAKILFIGLVIGLIEAGVAKMRLFRAVDFLVFAFLLSAVSFVAAIVGL